MLRRLLLPRLVVRVGLFFLVADAPAVVSVLGRRAVCHLDSAATEMQADLTPFFPEAYGRAFHRLRDLYDALAQRWRVAGETDLAEAPRQIPTGAELERLAVALSSLRERADALNQQARRLEERLADLEQYDYYVRALAELGVDARSMADLRFLHVRAGTVPAENLRRLEESAALAGGLILPLGTRQARAHVLVVGAGGISPDLEGLLGKAHFQMVTMPAAGQAGARDEIVAVGAERAEVARREEQLRSESLGPIREAAGVLACAEVLMRCDGPMQGRGAVAFLSGWVAEDRFAELDQALAREVPNPVVLLRQPAAEGGAHEPPPSLLSVPALFRPGASLIGLYGTPAHDELNPTLVLAVTAPLFFGMMFGDVGQGLVMLALTLAARRRLGRWVAPALACGLSCVLFGLLYGSVFGVEEWLSALWLRPMADPFRLLTVSLGVGAGFLLLTFALNGLNLTLGGRSREALLSFQGGAGAMCYAGGLLWLRALAKGEPSAAPVVLLLSGVAALAVYAVGEVRSHGWATLGALSTEVLHNGLGLLTNTLSFLRLGAFALNHAALSMALFLLVAMIPPTPAGWAGRVFLLVVGSAFILVLDALVVAVQTIRLEFYEGLTRYYRGDGKEFSPLQFPEVKAE